MLCFWICYVSGYVYNETDNRIYTITIKFLDVPFSFNPQKPLSTKAESATKYLCPT